MKFRVPLFKPNNKSLEFVKKFKILSFSRVLKFSFSFGVSSKMMFLLWCVFGGFLLHFFECRFLETLIKPDYEKPVDTAQDILDRDLTILYRPFTSTFVDIMKKSDSAVTRELAERIIVPKVL